MLICGLLLTLPLVFSDLGNIVDELIYTATADALMAVAWLGLMPAGFASIIYFIVVNRAGPSFLSNCNFLIPVVAYFAGTLILGDAVPSTGLIALAGILAGIGITRISR